MRRLLLLATMIYGMTCYSQVIPFDLSWKFMEDAPSGAALENYDDSGWKEVSLPHDFIIERDFTGKNGLGPFLRDIKDSISTGNLPGGTGWYRKHFSLGKVGKSEKVEVVFDGVMVQSDVWINGHHLGFHPNGYTPFHYDITPYLNRNGGENVIVVKAVNTGDNTRWYCGGGIYRSVYLKRSATICFPVWGIQAKTRVEDGCTFVDFSIPVENNAKKATTVKADVSITDHYGATVSTATATGKITSKGDTLHATCQIEDAKMWSPDNPYLYKAVVKLSNGKRLLDTHETKIGLRTLYFSADEGFLLNGESTKLHGACIHHDNGVLGAAALQKAEARKVRILKENGFNAIRSAHNRPSKALLDACDSLGMFVIDESFDCWLEGKRDNDYHLYFEEWSGRDQAAIVECDRNHPSVLMWSIGNEIPGDQKPVGVEHSRRLAAIVKAYDTTRPVTDGVCSFPQMEGHVHDWLDGKYSALDIWGYNYRLREIAADHILFPDRIIVSTESFPRETYLNYKMEQMLPCYLGSFVWTGMDHIGEVGIGNAIYSSNPDERLAIPTRSWPWYVSFAGDIDLIGNKKAQSYYRDVVWDRSDIEIAVAPYKTGMYELVSKWGWYDELPSWNWQGHEGDTMTVRVYTKSSEVELSLNGRVIDRKPVMEDCMTAEFRVPYEEGTLTAIALSGGCETANKSLTTQSGPYRIELTAEDEYALNRQNEISYVRIRIVDRQGNIVPDATVPLTLEVSGGKLLASGNGAPDDMRSFRSATPTTWHGSAIAVLRPTATGAMTLTVSAEGFSSAQATIEVLDKPRKAKYRQ
ncbi:MAG: DUF4982 domain-containing protein [Prevotella sp.]|nr:DUF4982 domain-containing protein [Prevotella sp.]